MIHQLLQTDADYVPLFLRLIAGIIIFPYGMQKLLAWFNDFGGGVGIKETISQMNAKKIPTGVAWLIIIGQSAGSIALLLGCLGRLAAGANFIIFAGALIVHAPEGWTINWSGKKRERGLNILSCFFLFWR